ncbi:MAG: AAA family ATPase [Clostridiales bacterium]
MKRETVGVDDFKEFIDNDLYFVDKTMFIKDIIDDSSKVLLITRPMGFGKTLNMSLLEYYFEKTKDEGGFIFR